MQSSEQPQERPDDKGRKRIKEVLKGKKTPPPLHSSPNYIAKKLKERKKRDEEEEEEEEEKMLVNEFKELVKEMKERADRANPKVKERFEAFFLPRYKDGSYGVRMNYHTIRNDFGSLIENPDHESGGGHYKGWSVLEIEELYWVIYGEEW